MVLHAERHVVAGLHARVAQQARQPVGGRVQLGERRHRAGRRHHDRGLVGLGVDEGAGVHAPNVPAVASPPEIRSGTRRRYVHPMDPGAEQFARLDHFARLMAGTATTVPLGASALALSAVLQSRPTDDAAVALDVLAASCPTPTFEGVRRHLYDDLGFGGDQQEYDHPRNSFLDLVVERRRGLPILLATVFVEVATRVGVGAVGIGMPMHFLVRSAEDADAFVDPFTGEALDRLGARRRFESLTQGQLRWDDRHLAPTPPRLIVVRMLANLKSSYERRADRLGVAMVALMRASIPELAPTAGVEAVRLAAVLN
jgi:hypothetical protein